MNPLTGRKHLLVIRHMGDTEPLTQRGIRGIVRRQIVRDGQAQYVLCRRGLDNRYELPSGLKTPEGLVPAECPPAYVLPHYVEELALPERRYEPDSVVLEKGTRLGRAGTLHLQINRHIDVGNDHSRPSSIQRLSVSGPGARAVVSVRRRSASRSRASASSGVRWGITRTCTPLPSSTGTSTVTRPLRTTALIWMAFMALPTDFSNVYELCPCGFVQTENGLCTKHVLVHDRPARV